MSNLDLAVIGNCSFSALVDSSARIVWACLPRFGSDPRFCSLLNDSHEDAQGVFAVDLLGMEESSQQYRHNSAIVETRLQDANGSSVLVTDFAPRFKLFGRTYRPATLIRQISPLTGTPRIKVRVRPTSEYGQQLPTITHGSNHIRYVMPDLTLRLTTDASVAYVLEETPFILDKPLTFFLGPDETLTMPVAEAYREHFEQTDQY